MSEQKAETTIDDVMAHAGFVPVIHYVGEGTKPSCPEGFFMMEYRRLDDPHVQVILSLSPHGKEAHDFMQVAIRKVGVPGDSILSRAISSVFASPVIFKAQDVIDNPSLLDEVLPDRPGSSDKYKVMARTLHNLEGITFFMPAKKISNSSVVLKGSASPAAFGVVIGNEGEQFASTFNTRSVEISLAITNVPHKAVMKLEADNAFNLGKLKKTLPQEVSVNWFNESGNAQRVIARHVTGLAAPASGVSQRQHHIIAPR
ncbi:MAG: hypothetical protein ACK4NR_02575 [Micavibrio sp.]